MSGIEDYGRANPEKLREAGIPHATSVGRIEQLTEIPVKETNRMILPIIGGKERVYPVNKEGVDITPYITDKTPPAKIVRHEWSYAVVPGQNNFNIYLTGFCKNCQTAFTAELNTTHYSIDWKPLDGIGDPCITKLDIPLYGCEYKKY